MAICTQPPQISPAAAAYCAEQGLGSAFSLSLDLVERCFPEVSGLRVGLHRDPESGDTSLVIHSQVAGSPEDALACYQRYVERWTASAPTAAVNKVALDFVLP